ncbi:MAG: BolA family protein [Rickettsiaceae bacterium]|nr:BolA family protein [Rickettsiaceae bacterium]
MQIDKLASIKILLSSINPSFLEIEDESHTHAGHYFQNPDSLFPSHISIKIVSSDFIGLNLIARHRIINHLLEDAYHNGLHAVRIKALSPQENNK